MYTNTLPKREDKIQCQEQFLIGVYLAKELQTVSLLCLFSFVSLSSERNPSILLQVHPHNMVSSAKPRYVTLLSMCAHVS